LSLSGVVVVILYSLFFTGEISPKSGIIKISKYTYLKYCDFGEFLSPEMTKKLRIFWARFLGVQRVDII
jgi:hypothetical protein